MLDRTQSADWWRSITMGEFEAMSEQQRRTWGRAFWSAHSGGRSDRPHREPFTSADLQREHQEDHNTHIENGEVSVGRRR